jgi:hypothetical protein
LIRCRSRFVLILLVLLLAVPRQSSAYSVLTHEAIVDLAWDDSIKPLLLSKYPNLTEAQLRDAHAFAYGGCAIQDMGYYPFGTTFFSDLTHYVRSGDFVAALIRNAHTANELAFAAGALSHYIGDSSGHSIAVNQATAIAFPKLGKRYGPIVTYENNPHAHVRTEFGFDIDQVAKKRFAPQVFKEHVGLKVPTRLLEAAFFEIYGIPLYSLVGHERSAAHSYRSAVRSFIPFFARGEVVLHRHQFVPETPTRDFVIYEKEVSRQAFRRHWAATYHGPGFRGYLSAALIVLLPKIGPVSLLSIKIPDAETQQLYVQSMNTTLEHFRSHLNELKTEPIGQFTLADRDLDTGAKVRPGGYALTDETYAALLHDVVTRPTMTIPLGLREDILSYYADPNAPITTKRDPKKWAEVQEDLAKFRQMHAGSRLSIPREDDQTKP